MNPISHDYEDLLRIFLYDYLNKRGFGHTAEIFRREAQVTQQPAPEFEVHPNGFLHDWWSLFYDTYIRQQQAHGNVWDYTPKIFSEGYALKCLGGFASDNALLACDFSSDGKILASGGFERKVFLCYMETCDSVTTSEAHLENISDIRFQPETTIFATSSFDKTVKLWDATKPCKLLFNLVGHNGWVRSLDFHPTEGVLCSSDTYDVIEMWDVNQCVKIKNFLTGGKLVRFQPKIGRFLAIVNGKVINILDMQTWGVQNCLQGHLTDIRSMCWDITGQMIASVSEDSARVWSVVVCRHSLYQLDSKGMKFQSIIFHPRYHGVLLIGGFQCMQLWIPENGEVITIPTTKASITGLAASKQNEFIASASSDSVVKIWK